MIRGLRLASNGPVRAFVESDLGQVADLHRRVFEIPDGDGVHRPDAAPSPWLSAIYEAYFREVFLDHPWRDDEIGPLVYTGAGGRIDGFLGVVPRPMTLEGMSVRVAICTQFVVDPQRRGMAGLQLLSAHFRRTQDLSVTDEANEVTRRVWESRGGRACASYGIRWWRPLRPLRYALGALGRRGGAGALSRAGALLAPILDHVAGRWSASPVHRPASRLEGSDLAEPELLALHTEFAAESSLRPEYDERSWRWTLERAAAGRIEDLHRVAVRDGERTAGFYVYQIEPGGIAEVLAIAARRGSLDVVFDHLLDHAWRHDALAVSGRLDPRLLRELRDRGCLLRPGGPSMLIQSKRPDLLESLDRGDAFFTRLEGEWCLRFRPERQLAAAPSRRS
jgi:hypothetical protein